MAPEMDFDAVAERFRDTYNLAVRDARAIAELLALCELRSLAKDELLFREREEGAKAYFLLHGRIGVSRRDPAGAAMHVSTLEAPTLVGHMSLVDDATRSATCTAVAPSIVAGISRALFQELVASGGARGSALRRLLIAAMSEQLAGANARILTIIDPPPDYPVDDETTEHGIEEASRVLDGWKPQAS